MDAIIAEARERYCILSESEWEEVQADSNALRVVEASLDHRIELRARAGELLAKETSDRDEIILRVFPSEYALDAFIQRRVDLYERMWDGCGCKVDYYD